MTKRVACYCRVSSEEQADRETIQAQVEALEKYCRDRGWTIAEWYLDDGVSGDVPFEQREGGKALVAAARAGQFKGVVALKVDRLGRKTQDNLRVVELLHEELGLEFSCSSQPFEVTHATGRLMLTMLAGFAEFEKAMILERTKTGLDRVAHLGRWPAGKPAYGYMIGTEGAERGCLVVDPVEGPVVKRIFDLYLQGWGVQKIAAWLNTNGIAPPRAEDRQKKANTRRRAVPRWNISTVHFILHNPAYYDRGDGQGEALYNRTRTKRKDGREVGHEPRDADEWVPVPCPALVSEEEWNAVAGQAKLNSAASKRNSRRLYALRGRIFCGLCGHRYCGFLHSSGMSKHHKKAYTYRRYRCGTAWSRSGQEKCANAQIRADVLEKIVWGRVRRIVEDPDQFLADIQADMSTQSPEDTSAQAEAELVAVDAALARLAEREQRVRRVHAKGLYDDEDDEDAADRKLQEELNDLKAERSFLKAERQRLEGETRPARDFAQAALSARNALAAFRVGVWAADYDEELRSDFMRALVRRIDVYPEEAGEGRKTARVVMHFSPAIPPHLVEDDGTIDEDAWDAGKPGLRARLNEYLASRFQEELVS
jgi:site-specific DNA recombinase